MSDPRWLTAAMLVLLSALGVVSLPDALTLDDAWTHFRTARNVAAGAGPVFTPGDGVIGSTSVLYVLLLGALAALSSVPTYAVAAGLHVASVPLLGWLARRLTPPQAFAGLAWLTPVLFVRLPYVRDCAGMEMPLYVATALGAVVLANAGRLRALGVVLTLSCLLRPDGGLLAVLVVGWITVRERRLPVATLVAATATALPWIGYALVEFGTLLPLSATAKFAHARSGLWESFGQHLGAALTTNFGWAWLALAAIGAAAAVVRRDGALLLLVAWVVVYDVVATFAGLTAYRWYYQPTLVVIALLATGGLSVLAAGVTQRWRAGALRPAGTSAATAAVAGVLVFSVANATRATLAPHDLVPHDDRYVPLARWIAARAPQGASLATLEIGLVGYHSDLAIVDFCGLVTPEVARRIPEGTHVSFCLDELRPDFVLAHHPASALEPGLLAALPERYRRIRTLADCSVWERVEGGERGEAIEGGERASDGASADGAAVEAVRFDAAAVATFPSVNVLQSTPTPHGMRHVAAHAGAVLTQRLDLDGPFRRVRIRLQVERFPGAPGDAGAPTTLHVAWTSTSQRRLHPTARVAAAVTPGPAWADVVVDFPPAWFVPGERLLDFVLMPASEPTIFTVSEIAFER